MVQNRKEDFVFKANITFNSVEVGKDVLCRVYLPVKMTDSLELRLFPTEEQAKRLTRLPIWQYSVSGEVKNFNGEIFMLISANKVFADKGVQTNFHGKDIREYLMVGSPEDLTLTQFFNGVKSEHNLGTVNGSFWVTGNPLLEPAGIISRSYTGNAEVETAWKFEFDINQIHITFEKHYRYYENDEGDTVSFDELVAGFKIEGATADSPQIPETLHKLNDVLLLASFAARQWCVCLGWSGSDSHMYVKHYIRNRTIPDKPNPQRSLRENLIEKSDFADFMKVAYSSFLSFTPNDPLRRAISLTIPIKNSILESEFVTLYTALEMLVLYFRRKKGLEYVFQQNDTEQKKQWNKIRKALKMYIDQIDLPENDYDKKRHMKDKLSELNRISFATAFEQFCNHYAVSLQDLWQVTNNKSGVSLSELRNKLVHGEHFNHEHLKALIFAKLHLQWTVERMILAVLGWNIEKSTISSWFLSTWVAYKEWKPEQILLSQKAIHITSENTGADN